jgi:hypothetical protein
MEIIKKQRGRPKKINVASDATNEEPKMETTVMPRDRSEIQEARPKRVPLHEQRDQLSTSQKTGFVRRWVNDVPGRVDKFLRAGYTIVTDKNVAVGVEGVTSGNNSLGSGATKNVGRTRSGDGTQAILMETTVEQYEADQKAKQSIVDSSDLAMKKKIRDNEFYGDIKQSATLSRGKTIDSE